LWLVDYRLACQLGGAYDDNLIIRNLPLFLSDAARAWLEHLPPAQISDWDDLVKAFAGNFQGMYVRPGNSWDLQSCCQQPRESLREYIRRFSRQRTELPNITDSDVIGAFLAGTTCRDLVSKLGRKTPTRASELMDVTTKFASGQETVEAIFRKDKQPQGESKEDAPEASAQRGAKKKAKKKAQAKRNAADANLVAAAEHRNHRKPLEGSVHSTRCSRSRAQEPLEAPLKNVSCSGATSIRPGPRRKMARAKATTRRRAARKRSSPRSTTAS
jgi:hypothetical protein